MMEQLDEIKQRLLGAMSELEEVRCELSALATNVADCLAELDDVLRGLCMADMVTDADMLMLAHEGKKEMKEQQRHLGKNYDF